LGDSVVVMDASAGVKLFVEEPGSDLMRDLFAAHMRGDVRIEVPDLFVYEVLRTVWRHDRGLLEEARAFFAQTRMRRVAPDDRLIRAAMEQSALLGCDLYDAFPAGLASLLGAPLYSADAKAHALYPGVVLVGQESATSA
jgi:predicted nucleic acid-binding protein